MIPFVISRLKGSLKNIIRYSPVLRRDVTMLMINKKFPSVLGIDPTNACNLKCSFCGAQKTKGDVGYMDLDFFRKVILESVRFGKRWMIILHNAGEPLLHKDICEMVRYIKEKGAARSVQFATNGLVLTEDVARGLIRAGLDQLTFSVDAYSPEEYEKLKGIDGLPKVIENSKMIMRLKGEAGSPLPFVSAKMARRRGFEGTFKPFVRMWSKITDEALLTPYSNWGGAVKDEGVEKVPSKRYACHFLWYYPVINWDGKVFFCCASCDEGSVIGDMRESTMHDIWKSERIERVRAAHLSGRFDQVPACSGCTYWAEAGCNLDWWFRLKQGKGSR